MTELDYKNIKAWVHWKKLEIERGDNGFYKNNPEALASEIAFISTIESLIDSRERLTIAVKEAEAVFEDIGELRSIEVAQVRSHAWLHKYGSKNETKT